jgi:Na+-translocating ferredoxin:NAD+ oxidoreductase subunit B
MKRTDQPENPPRRSFLRQCLGTVAGAMVCGTGLAALRGGVRTSSFRWQIDPEICTQCGKCATLCVLPVSAVRCAHTFAMCGYCNLCFGYFDSQAPRLDAGGENQMCPTGALRRRFVEEPYFEYSVDEELCIGCGRCVKGCTSFGNGSLYLQVRHDRCLHCEECAIARGCPVSAFRRVPASHPYIPHGVEDTRT